MAVLARGTITVSVNNDLVYKGELSAPPANPEINWYYYNTTNGITYVYDGENWAMMVQDGRSVTSVKEQYYLSTSKTTQTGGSWQDEQQTWESGKYQWIRTYITYSSAPLSSTTTPYIDSSWEAVDAISFSSVNLLDDTQHPDITSPYWTAYSNGVRSIYEDDTIGDFSAVMVKSTGWHRFWHKMAYKANHTYVFRFYVKTDFSESTATTNKMNIYKTVSMGISFDAIYFDDVLVASSASTLAHSGMYTLTESWQKVEVVFTPTVDIAEADEQWRVEFTPSNYGDGTTPVAVGIVYGYMLVKGNKIDQAYSKSLTDQYKDTYTPYKQTIEDSYQTLTKQVSGLLTNSYISEANEIALDGDSGYLDLAYTSLNDKLDNIVGTDAWLSGFNSDYTSFNIAATSLKASIETAKAQISSSTELATKADVANTILGGDDISYSLIQSALAGDPVFTWADGVVVMTNAFIAKLVTQDAFVDNLTINKLQALNAFDFKLQTINEFDNGSTIFYSSGRKRMELYANASGEEAGLRTFNNDGTVAAKLTLSGGYITAVSPYWEQDLVNLHKYTSEDDVKTTAYLASNVGIKWKFNIGNIYSGLEDYQGVTVEATTQPQVPGSVSAIIAYIDSLSGKLAGFYTRSGIPYKTESGQYGRTKYQYLNGRLISTGTITWQ